MVMIENMYYSVCFGHGDDFQEELKEAMDKIKEKNYTIMDIQGESDADGNTIKIFVE